MTRITKGILLDHISAGWGSYGVAMYGMHSAAEADGDRVTIQNNLWHESIAGHNVSVPLGVVHGVYKRVSSADRRLQLWENLDIQMDLVANAFIGISHRQPANFGGGEKHTGRQINNYVYHWSSRIASASDSVNVDYVNNLFEASAATPTHDYKSLFQWNEHTIMDGTDKAEPEKKPSFYIKSNEFRHADGSTLISSPEDQWPALTHYGNENNLDRKYERTMPLSRGVSIPILEVGKVKEEVLKNAGSGVRFDASGRIYNDSKIDQK